MMWTPQRDLRENRARAKSEMWRSVLWLLSCAYVSIAAAISGVVGALLASATLLLALLIAKGLHR